MKTGAFFPGREKKSHAKERGKTPIGGRGLIMGFVFLGKKERERKKLLQVGGEKGNER